MVAYQKHSKTSRDASELLTTAEALRLAVTKSVENNKENGCTGDELSLLLDVVPGTISARLIEAETRGYVIRTKRKRLTRKKRQAYVYVHPKFFNEEMGRQRIRGISHDQKEQDGPLWQLGENLFKKINLTADGGGKINLTPLELSIVENLAQRIGMKY